MYSQLRINLQLPHPIYWGNGSGNCFCAIGLNFRLLNTEIHSANVQIKFLLHKGIHLRVQYYIFQGIIS